SGSLSARADVKKAVVSFISGTPNDFVTNFLSETDQLQKAIMRHCEEIARHHWYFLETYACFGNGMTCLET
ncbi:MAG: hypothetical protein EBY46_11145, partial [Rhodobacteraceae bacterium]|nr:hypothetical protein [Paracoccaceae bacterium]